MKITMLHYHLRPGGVTTVIRNAQRALTPKYDVEVLADVGYNARSARSRAQFIALSAGRSQPPDGHRHIGLVVDGREETLARASAAGATMLADNDFLDPWGNHWQVVDYREIQFTKTPRILEGMGLDGLEKSKRALDELRAKGLAD